MAVTTQIEGRVLQNTFNTVERYGGTRAASIVAPPYAKLKVLTAV
jgi:hypothetical protein